MNLLHCSFQWQLPSLADPGVQKGGGATGHPGFGNRCGIRGGSRGPGQCPGSFGVYRSLYMSFTLLWYCKNDFKFRVFYS
jgi:hypothetical protein